jgi:DNA-directed RNA polymerase subunit RPC12/RpoP
VPKLVGKRLSTVGGDMMGFLERLLPNLLVSFLRRKNQTKGTQGYTKLDGPSGLWFYVQCDRCGEKIAVRLRTTSEVQRREGPDADLGPGQHFVTKTIVGSRCYQRIEATIDLDSRYNVVGSTVQNGRLITHKEYEEKDEH